MPLKKISELTTGSASLTSIVPMSDASGTVTNKVAVSSILAAETKWNLFLPPAPSGLTATGGNAQVSLSWTAPTVLAQTPITDYLVQYSTNSGSTWTTFSDGTSTATNATVTGLTNGTAYTFRVAAVNGVGTGAYTAGVSSTPSGAIYIAIPSMTSATAPSGVVSTSMTPGVNISWRPGLYGGDLSDFWRAFDGSGLPGLKMDAANNGNVSGWIQYAFPAGSQSNASGYRMKARTPDSGQAPPAVLLEASNDGTSFTTVLNSTGLSWSADETKTFTFASPVSYRYWRWTVSPGYSGYADIGNVQLLE